MKEAELRSLMEAMTIDEKIGQLVQLSGECFGTGDIATGPAAKIGVTEEDIWRSGSVLNVMGADDVHSIQDAYMAKSRLHIPLLFMADVVYGYKTCFPAPIGLGCTFDPARIEEAYSLIADEAQTDGCMVTFSPAADVVRDARWGRVMEMPGGEDPYLGSAMAEAMVRGFQKRLPEGRGLASCVKHFAGYGAAEGGREYNTVDMSERRLRQEYLPPYRAAVDAGAKMVMTSFNTVDGVPATANRWLMHDVLREEWGFAGPLITDYAAILELMNHGVAADKDEASELALKATVDIDMKTDCYAHSLKRLLAEGRISEDEIDRACWRVLSLKNELGLFEDPYRGCSEAAAEESLYKPVALDAARACAEESLVLLKNASMEDGKPVLPLAQGQKIALVGPYADSRDIIGMWAIHAGKGPVKTVREALAERLGEGQVLYAKGTDILVGEELQELGEFARFAGLGTEPGPQEPLIEEALHVCAEAAICILCLGEHALQSGEAGARTKLRLPAQQMELLRRVHALGKPVVCIIFSGRPLVLTDVEPLSDSVIEAWWPGTMGGEALAAVLLGETEPTGRLTMSMPYAEGQEPLYYCQYPTGRPAGKNHSGRFVTGYLDAPIGGLHPFGYGLGYHTSVLSEPVLDRAVLHPGEKLAVSVTLENKGPIAGTDVVQLYFHDCVASVTRPVKQLCGFRRVHTEPGETVEMRFEIAEEMLRFWRRDMTYGSEPGRFEVFCGLSSAETRCAEFILEA